jgi:hypothetical protein
MVEDICGLLHSTFSVIPLPILIVDDDMRIIFANPRASELFPKDKTEVKNMRAGEALVCKHALDKGCGRGEFCPECVLRNSVGETLQGKQTLRRKVKMGIMRDRELKQANLYVTTALIKSEGRDLSLLMLEDVNEIMQLAALLPICAECKKIRNEKNEWINLEAYLESHIDVDFSHSFCPECLEKLYPEIWEDIKKNQEGK